MSNSADGSLWRDVVQDYGVLPGTANQAATRVAVQAAIDAPIPQGASRAAIYFPDNQEKYYVDEPIWQDIDGISIVGEGIGFSCLSSFGYSFPPIISGIKRNPSSICGEATTPLPRHWVDLGEPGHNLDSWVCTGPGQGRWGFQTGGDSMLVFPSGGLSLGPRPYGWGSVDVLYVSMIVDGGRCRLASSGIFAGLWDADKPSPYGVMYSSGYIGLTIQTADRIKRTFYIQVGDITTLGVTRVEFQVDLRTAEVIGGLNRVQKAVGLWAAGAGWNSGNHRLADRRIAHFGIGFESRQLGPSDMLGGSNIVSLGAAFSNWYADVCMLGFYVGNETRYQDNGPGHALVRVDGATPKDADLFTRVAGTIDFISNLIGPTTSKNPRMIRSNTAFGLLLNPGNAKDVNAVRNCSIEDMSLQTIGTYGHAFMQGITNNFEGHRIEFQDGAYGVGALNMAATYKNVWSGLRFGYHSEASFYQYFSMGQGSDFFVRAGGRRVFYFAGSSFKFDGGFVGNGVGTEYIYKSVASDGGGVHEINGLDTDNENNGLPIKAFYSFEQDRYSPNVALIRGGSHGNCGPDAAMLELTSNQQPNDPAVPSGYVSIEGVRTFLNQIPGGYLRRDANWRGAVRIDGEVQ